MDQTTSVRPGAAFQHGAVEVFGHSVGFAQAGAGERTMVLCPGSAGMDMSWAKDTLAQRIRVIELNPPGWGGRPPLQHPIDQRDLAVVLCAALESLDVQRYHLHGTSMGGVTALWMAAQYPERTLTLSLEGGMNFVDESDLVNPEQAKQLHDMIRRNDPEGSGYPQAAPHPRKPWATTDFVRGQMKKRIPMMRMLTNRHESVLRRLVADMDVETLVLLGDRDEILRAHYLDRWATFMPSARRYLVKDGTHDLQNSEPEVFVAQLLKLIGSKAD